MIGSSERDATVLELGSASAPEIAAAGVPEFEADPMERAVSASVQKYKVKATGEMINLPRKQVLNAGLDFGPGYFYRDAYGDLVELESVQ